MVRAPILLVTQYRFVTLSVSINLSCILFSVTSATVFSPLMPTLVKFDDLIALNEYSMIFSIIGGFGLNVKISGKVYGITYLM